MNTLYIKNLIINLPFFLLDELKSDLRKLRGIKNPKNPPLASHLKASEEALFETGRLEFEKRINAQHLKAEIEEAIYRHTHGVWTNNWQFEVNENREHLTAGKGHVFSIQKISNGRELWITTDLAKEITEAHFRDDG